MDWSQPKKSQSQYSERKGTSGLDDERRNTCKGTYVSLAKSGALLGLRARNSVEEPARVKI